jgi:hypothetical protein
MFFSFELLYVVFSRSESLAKSLQSPKLSLSKADNMVKALSSVWKTIRSDSGFTTLWQDVQSSAVSLGIDPPALPRPRRIPRRVDHGSSSPQHEDQCVEDIYRRLYFTSVDAAISCLSSRFQNPSFQLAHTIESTSIEVVNTGKVPPLQTILTHYGDDIDASRLMLHLEMLGDVCRSVKPPGQITDIAQVVQLFQENEGWSLMLEEVVNLLKLFLTLPVTSCTAERSFSCLRRLKTFLRSTLTQKRLNHIAVLHCHREQTVNLKEICNNFIVRNDIRRSIFMAFPDNQ